MQPIQGTEKVLRAFDCLSIEKRAKDAATNLCNSFQIKICQDSLRYSFIFGPADRIGPRSNFASNFWNVILSVSLLTECMLPWWLTRASFHMCLSWQPDKRRAVRLSVRVSVRPSSVPQHVSLTESLWSVVDVGWCTCFTPHWAWDCFLVQLRSVPGLLAHQANTGDNRYLGHQALRESKDEQKVLAKSH